MRKIPYILGLSLCVLLISCTPIAERGLGHNNVAPTGENTEAPNVIPPPAQATPTVENAFEFSTFDIREKYYSDAGSYVELDLKLPKIYGDYAGISKINEFFVNKEQFFYDELPFDSLQGFEEAGRKAEGMKDGFFRSAHYGLEVKLGHIISISAVLDGGAGGVSWAGIEANTFDLNTGKKLGLSDIFKVNETEYMEFIYGFVSEKIMDDINKSAETGSPYSFNDAYSGDGYKMIRDFEADDFYLTENAFIVFYQKYALAAGAAGPQIFEIPYESMVDLLAIDINKS